MATPRDHHLAAIAGLFAHAPDEAVVAGGIIKVFFRSPGFVDESTGVITSDPTALVWDDDIATYDITGGEPGSAIIINAVSYTVRDRIPLLEGMTTLILELA